MAQSDKKSQVFAIFKAFSASPISGSSLKENTSPGEETTVVALLRYGCVANSLRQRLFFVFAGMFLRSC